MRGTTAIGWGLLISLAPSGWPVLVWPKKGRSVERGRPDWRLPLCAVVCRDGFGHLERHRGTAPQSGRLLSPHRLSFPIYTPQAGPGPCSFFSFSSCLLSAAMLAPLPLALLSLVLSLATPDAQAAATPRRPQPGAGRSIAMSRRNFLNRADIDLDQWLINNKLATEAKYGMGGSASKRAVGSNQ